MRVRKMIMAAGVIALAVAGCGSKVAAKPGGEAPAKAPAGPAITECVGCATHSDSTATVPYPTEFRSEETTKLEVTVISVEKGTASDLKDLRTDDPANKERDPYYLKMKFRNVGDKATDPQTIFAQIGLYNSDGSGPDGLGYHDDFARCATAAPVSLAPGAEYTECQIYVAQPGQQKVVKVVYHDVVGPSTDEQTIGITWNVG